MLSRCTEHVCSTEKPATDRCSAKQGGLSLVHSHVLSDIDCRSDTYRVVSRVRSAGTRG